MAIAGGLWTWHAVKQAGAGIARVTTAWDVIQAGFVKPAPAEATTASIGGQAAGDPLPLLDSGVAEDQGARAQDTGVAIREYLERRLASASFHLVT